MIYIFTQRNRVAAIYRPQLTSSSLVANSLLLPLTQNCHSLELTNFNSLYALSLNSRFLCYTLDPARKKLGASRKVNILLCSCLKQNLAWSHALLDTFLLLNYKISISLFVYLAGLVTGCRGSRVDLFGLPKFISSDGRTRIRAER